MDQVSRLGSKQLSQIHCTLVTRQFTGFLSDPLRYFDTVPETYPIPHCTLPWQDSLYLNTVMWQHHEHIARVEYQMRFLIQS